MADEELAAAGVLAGVRHGERAGDVLVHFAARCTFALVARAAGPHRSLAGFGVGVAALNHEVGDHAMELGAVVEAGVGQLLEVRDGIGRLVGKELELDGAAAGFHDSALIGHQVSTLELNNASSCSGRLTGSEQVVPTHTVACGVSAMRRTTTLRGRKRCSARRCIAHAAPGPPGPETSTRVGGC